MKKVIEYALAIGNYLNGGSNKGAAWGFKVDGLNKLIGTKTLDNKSTLLHYMARKLGTRKQHSSSSTAAPPLTPA